MGGCRHRRGHACRGASADRARVRRRRGRRLRAPLRVRRPPGVRHGRAPRAPRRGPEAHEPGRRLPDLRRVRGLPVGGGEAAGRRRRPVRGDRVRRPGRLRGVRPRHGRGDERRGHLDVPAARVGPHAAHGVRGAPPRRVGRRDDHGEPQSPARQRLQGLSRRRRRRIADRAAHRHRDRRPHRARCSRPGGRAAAGARVLGAGFRRRRRLRGRDVGRRARGPAPAPRRTGGGPRLRHRSPRGLHRDARRGRRARAARLPLLRPAAGDARARATPARRPLPDRRLPEPRGARRARPRLPHRARGERRPHRRPRPRCGSPRPRGPAPGRGLRIPSPDRQRAGPAARVARRRAGGRGGAAARGRGARRTRLHHRLVARPARGRGRLRARLRRDAVGVQVGVARARARLRVRGGARLPDPPRGRARQGRNLGERRCDRDGARARRGGAHDLGPPGRGE